MLTDVEGLYTQLAGQGLARAPPAAPASSRTILPTLDAGMRPKMEACWRAVEGGVGRAHVIDGREPHSILVEIFTSDGIGTMVLPDEEPADAPFTAPIPVVPPRPGSDRMTDLQRARHRADATPDATLPVPAVDGSVADWTDRYTHAVMDTFGAPQRVLVRGEGPYVWDADGNRYLDLLGGIAVNSLGHAHPTLTAAISAQLGTLGHVSNFFGSPTQIAFAERLLALAGAPQGSRVFLTNSGTEANEAAFKLARRTGPAARSSRSRARSTAGRWARSR